MKPQIYHKLGVETYGPQAIRSGASVAFSTGGFMHAMPVCGLMDGWQGPFCATATQLGEAAAGRNSTSDSNQVLAPAHLRPMPGRSSLPPEKVANRCCKLRRNQHELLRAESEQGQVSCHWETSDGRVLQSAAREYFQSKPPWLPTPPRSSSLQIHEPSLREGSSVLPRGSNGGNQWPIVRNC